MISAEQIKELREKTGISVAACKKALEQAGGDVEKAIAALQKDSASIAQKKSDRALGSGVVEAYVHNNKKVGVLVELKSESDFVSGNDEFRVLAKEIAMHVAACGPSDINELLDQAYVKDPGIMVKDLVNRAIQKFGEKIEITRFVRYSLS